MMSDDPKPDAADDWAASAAADAAEEQVQPTAAEVTPQAAPAKPRAKPKAKPKAEDVDPERQGPLEKSLGDVMKSKTTRIMLEENEHIPPSGLFVSVNGRAYLIAVGVEVDVPNEAVEVLRNAKISLPQVNPQTRQVVGYRDRSRYPFTVIPT